MFWAIKCSSADFNNNNNSILFIIDIQMKRKANWLQDYHRLLLLKCHVWLYRAIAFTKLSFDKLVKEIERGWTRWRAKKYKNSVKYSLSRWGSALTTITLSTEEKKITIRRNPLKRFKINCFNAELILYIYRIYIYEYKYIILVTGWINYKSYTYQSWLCIYM